jgi:hypothetical protein
MLKEFYLQFNNYSIIFPTEKIYINQLMPQKFIHLITEGSMMLLNNPIQKYQTPRLEMII